MRIGHIEKFMTPDGSVAGGVGAYVRTLSNAMRDRGHEVFAFGCVDATGPAELPRYRDFNATRHPLAMVHLMHNADAAARLDAWLRRCPVDVAHLHNIYHHLTPAILPVLARHGVGMVMTCHDFRQCGSERLFWRWPVPTLDLAGIEDHYAATARRHCAGLGGALLGVRSLVDRMLRRYDRWVDLYLCPSRTMARAVHARGVRWRKIRLVRNPVPVLHVRDEPPRSNVVLSVGRLAVEKSPELLLPLARALSGAKVQVAGDGPMREPLGVAATRERVWNLELLGHLSEGALAEAYRRASVVVLSSRCTENSPGTLLEAMAVGCCVVAPDQQAIREWVSEGKTGRLYPTGDVGALIATVRELLADRRQRWHLGQAAARRLAAMHVRDEIMDQVQQAYVHARQIARCRCESQ